MAQYKGLAGSALMRLLEQLKLQWPASGGRKSKQMPAERLSQWLSWTDAIALSAALEVGAEPLAMSPPTAGGIDEMDVVRVRAALAVGIAQDRHFNAGKGVGHGRLPTLTTAQGPVEFAPYRQRYVAEQQSMELAIGALRNRLQATLTTRSPALARLAALDGVMAQVLGPREHGLLATLPTLLERHFQRLRQPDGAGTWLGVFAQDMRAMLLAELDLRLQPVEGLTEALRLTTGHHE